MRKEILSVILWSILKNYSLGNNKKTILNWPCKALKLVDGLQSVESGGKHIPSIGIVVNYILDSSPQEVKRGLEDPF